MNKYPVQNANENEPTLLTLEETMQKLRVGRTKLYQMIGSEGLPVLRSGRYVRIPSDLLQQWIREHVQSSV